MESSPRTSRTSLGGGPSLSVDQRVTVLERAGTVRFVGTTEFAAGVWVGIELDEPVGKNDGSVRGVAYFSCEQRHGIFVRGSQVVPIDAGGGNPASPSSPSRRSAQMDQQQGTPPPQPQPQAQQTPAQPDGSPEAASSARQSQGASAAAAAGPGAAPSAGEAAPAPPPAKQEDVRAQQDAAAKAQAEREAALRAQQEAAAAKAQAQREAAIRAKQEAEVKAQNDPVAKSHLDAEAKAERDVASLKAELERLEREVAAAGREVSDTKRQRQDAQQELQQAEEEAARASADSATRLAELEQRAVEAARDEGALREQQAGLAKATGALQEQTRQLEKIQAPREDQEEQEEQAVAPSPKAGADPELKQLRVELATERSRRDLLGLEMEEVALQLEDARDALAFATDAEQWTGDVQVEWHQHALAQLYEDHCTEMRRLRRQAAKLERAQFRAQTKRDAHDEDISTLKWSVEQLSFQNESLSGRAGNFAEAVQERECQRRTNMEMEEADGALEAALSDELERQQARVSMLEAAALRLSQGREELKRRRQAQHSEAIRLESRLHALRAQRGSLVDRVATVNVGTAELDAKLLTAKGHVADVHAQAWAACLPSKMHEDAELGQSFRTLCTLHCCVRKAQILSRCIHDHYIADPVLVVLQTDLPMQWLCHACLASAQVAYAAVCFLGRLHALGVEKYRSLIRNPAVVACSDGEAALDTALNALLDMLRGAWQAGMGAHAVRGKALQEALAAINAQGAQLLSLQGVFFKDEQFVSWQSACCAVEALRAVCAFALYASDDAGGSRRQQWQNLYERAHRLVSRVARDVRPDGDGLFDVQPAEVQPQSSSTLDVEGADGDPDFDGEEPPTDVGPEPAVCLNQTLIDALLRQVASLDTGAAYEPGPDEDKEADALDRALSHADSQLTTLSQALELRQKTAPAAEVEERPLPWVCLREGVRSQVEENDRKAPTAKTEVENQLQSVTEALKVAEGRLQKEQEEVREVERRYGAARMSAEHFKIAETSVTRLKGQAKSGKVQQETLEQQLQKERKRVEEVEQATADTRRRCRELEQQVRECERRLEKRFNAQVPPEDVLALRRMSARQQREISELRLAKASGGVAAAPLLPAAGRRTGAVGSEEILNCWQGLQEAQTRLLLEQAGTSLVSLEEPEPEAAPLQQRGRIEALAESSAKLRQSTTALLSEVVGPGKESGGASAAPFASIALTRYLRSTTEAAKRGPARRLVFPLPADCKGAERFPPALPLQADLVQLQAMHGALL